MVVGISKCFLWRFIPSAALLPTGNEWCDFIPAVSILVLICASAGSWTWKGSSKAAFPPVSHGQGHCTQRLAQKHPQLQSRSQGVPTCSSRSLFLNFRKGISPFLLTKRVWKGKTQPCPSPGMLCPLVALKCREIGWEERAGKNMGHSMAARGKPGSVAAA